MINRLLYVATATALISAFMFDDNKNKRPVTRAANPWAGSQGRMRLKRYASSIPSASANRSMLSMLLGQTQGLVRQLKLYVGRLERKLARYFSSRVPTSIPKHGIWAPLEAAFVGPPNSRCTRGQQSGAALGDVYTLGGENAPLRPFLSACAARHEIEEGASAASRGGGSRSSRGPSGDAKGIKRAATKFMQNSGGSFLALLARHKIRGRARPSLWSRNGLRRARAAPGDVRGGRRRRTYAGRPGVHPVRAERAADKPCRTAGDGSYGGDRRERPRSFEACQQRTGASLTVSGWKPAAAPPYARRRGSVPTGSTELILHPAEWRDAALGCPSDPVRGAGTIRERAA